MIMRADDLQRTDPPWVRSSDFPRYSPLQSDALADTCVIGAGIAGLTTAYLLARTGRRVVVLDSGPVGGGETGRTTAHLSCVLDDRFTELERLHGERGARLALESHAAAIDRIEAITRDEAIPCDFKRLDGYLFAGSRDDEALLGQEFDAAQRLGFPGVEQLDRAPAPFDTGPCLRFPRQGQFHPLKYLAALARFVERRGGLLFTGTHARDVETSRGSYRHAVRTDTAATVHARHVVVATNTPFLDRFTIHTKQAAYRTYAIACRVPAGSVDPILLWDTRQSPDTPDSEWSHAPYHYVRLHPADGYDLLIVGGEDHKTGQETEDPHPWQSLEAWAAARYPMIQFVEHRWSGQVMEPVDGLAFIGHNPLDDPGIYIATGDSGHGMTHGTLAGILITDLIAGIENPWAALYDPSRKTLRAPALKRYLRENLNVAAQYRDFVTPGDVDSIEDIPRGEGAVLRRGTTKLAVYRSANGQAHQMSAVCPHLGCVVRWNNAEKSWDCPCHGSRFDRFGNVLNGPALASLRVIPTPTAMPTPTE